MSIGLEVAQVSHVAGLISWSAVCLSVWVDFVYKYQLRPSLNNMLQRPLTVRACRCAAVGVVTELMNVHATLSIWVIAFDIPCDGSG